MPNMNPHKTPMPSQDPKVRAHNFLEVSQGYTEEMAQEEAARCLNCKHIIADASNLPAVCGRVCPQENQCEKVCVRGIKGDPVGIGRLERFVADRHNNQPRQQVSLPAPNGHKVAVIGSGPSGLTCAGDLAKKGYAVTVFEALHSRVPSAQGHRAEGSGQPQGDGRQDRDQHGHRQGALHRRADG